MNTIYEARKTSEIAYDRKSFIIGGRNVFLHSAAIHYFRIPKEEWREVLVKAKLAGMNCVDTYFAWNVHEPNEGEWNFDGDADCGAFLDLCAELGLWVIARPGPFICAEWDFGGFPWWLSRKAGVKFRDYNDVYLKYVDLYFDRITEIIRTRQTTAGGSVILVQVENEYGYLADDERGSRYLSHLRDGLLRRGIDVPLITCVGGVEGAIEGANFWSGADHHYEQLVKKQPDTLKVVTEFWSGWFEHWGAPAATQKTPQLYEKRMFEAVRAGFSGINHYMFFGGTNFGGYGGRTVGASDIFMVTSYDYDAPLNEYGRTTPKYFAAKRFSYWVRAIEPFLLASEPADVSGVKASPGIRVRGRKLNDQRLLFVESGKEERETFHLTLEDGKTLPLLVNPGEIVPILDSFEIRKGLRLTCTTAIACNEVVDGVRTLIAYARSGQRSTVELTAVDDMSMGVLEAPALERWESRMLDLPTVQGVVSVQPQDFAAFSQPFGYLLYSCRIEREFDGPTTLVLPKLQDTARVYVNGTEEALLREIGSASVELRLREGSNLVQLLVQHMGRLNFSPDLGEPKGLFQTGYANGSTLDLRRGWTVGEKAFVHLDQVASVDGHPILSRTFRIEGQDRAVLVGAVSEPLYVNGEEVPLEGYRNWFAHRSVDISPYMRQGRIGSRCRMSKRRSSAWSFLRIVPPRRFASGPWPA